MSRVENVYGQGLYALAKDERLEDAIAQELEALETAFAEQPEFLKLLASCNLSKEERIGIVDSSFRGKVHIYVLNFLKLLTEKGYIRQFSHCCKTYKTQYNADKGILEVQAVAAIALKETQKQRLTEKLEAITGKKISLFCRVDPGVLGGIRLRFDGKQVDGTVRGRLEAMDKALKNAVL